MTQKSKLDTSSLETIGIDSFEFLGDPPTREDLNYLKRKTEMCTQCYPHKSGILTFYCYGCMRKICKHLQPEKLNDQLYCLTCQ